METGAKLLTIIPVLPSADIKRDVAWYKAKTGFECIFSDDKYAILRRDYICLHLQWHANTANDPLLGGSVVRLQGSNIKVLFEEFVKRGAVPPHKFDVNTPWGTNEFGFFDLNNNAIFIMEDIEIYA